MILKILKHICTPLWVGAWNEEEIIICLDAPFNDIQKITTQIKLENNDFVFFYWSGHAGFDTEKDELLLEITSKDELYEENFNKLAPKQLSIFDTCSTYLKNELRFSMQASTRTYAVCESYDDKRFLARKVYTDAVLNADASFEKYYSSQKGKPSIAETRWKYFYQIYYPYCTCDY